MGKLLGVRNVTARSAAGWIGGTLAKLCEVQDGRREELKAGLGAIGRAVLEMLCGATYITLAPGTCTQSLVPLRPASTSARPAPRAGDGAPSSSLELRDVYLRLQGCQLSLNTLSRE